MNRNTRAPGAGLTQPRVTRRTIARGAVWTAPIVGVAVAAPAYATSPGPCGVTGGITVGPNVTTDYRAICEAQSQWLHPGTIKAVYGNGQLPQYIDLCTCDAISGWYRWRETDTLDNFQIEVDGLHSDQNGPNQGYRPPVFLNLASGGACKRFALTYPHLCGAVQDDPGELQHHLDAATQHRQRERSLGAGADLHPERVDHPHDRDEQRRRRQLQRLLGWRNRRTAPSAPPSPETDVSAGPRPWGRGLAHWGQIRPFSPALTR